MNKKLTSAKNFVVRNKKPLIVATVSVVVILPLAWLADQGMITTSRTIDFVKDKNIYNEWYAHVTGKGI